MENFLKRYGNWGLVAGAAEGLGEAFCRVLASRGMNIILVDKKKDAMEDLATFLESNFEIATQCLHLDLAGKESSKAIMELAKNRNCRLLIYNAAYSRVKPLLDHQEDEIDKYLDVNCRTLLHTVYGFADHLKEYSSGGILMMSSLAGLWGTQLVAPYGATKAFTLNLAESLNYEFKQYNIDVMACISGATATPAYLSTNPKYGTLKPSVMEPGKVASYAVSQLGKKAYCIPGFNNKLNYFLMTRIFPRRTSGSLINRTMWKMYK